jgi:hypothetical protein
LPNGVGEVLQLDQAQAEQGDQPGVLEMVTQPPEGKQMMQLDAYGGRDAHNCIACRETALPRLTAGKAEESAQFRRGHSKNLARAKSRPFWLILG